VKAVGKCLEVHRVRDEAIRRRMGEKKGGREEGGRGKRYWVGSRPARNGVKTAGRAICDWLGMGDFLEDLGILSEGKRISFLGLQEQITKEASVHCVDGQALHPPSFPPLRPLVPLHLWRKHLSTFVRLSPPGNETLRLPFLLRTDCGFLLFPRRLLPSAGRLDQPRIRGRGSSRDGRERFCR
jgi:hypothetical protein